MSQLTHYSFLHSLSEHLDLKIIPVLKRKDITAVVSVLKSQSELSNVAGLFQSSILGIQEETFTEVTTEGFWITVIDVLCEHFNS
jgi:hypothetical protein